MSVLDRDSPNSGPVTADRLLSDAARAADGARERLATALVELFLPADSRLTDQQRITMARLLAGLVSAVEDDLRRRLIELLDAEAPDGLKAALAIARIEIAGPILENAQVLRDADLVAVLLRRADEHRLASALVLRAAPRELGAGLIDQLLDATDPGVAAAAMGLLIAESRRFDHFGDPVVARTELPAELQHRLVWWVAAALRTYMISRHGLDPVAADRATVAAASAMLAGYDEAVTLEGRAFELAARLNRAGGIDDALLVRALTEGRLAFLAAALGLRAGIDASAAWDMIVDSEGSRLAVLLRAIGCGRDAAAEILLRLALVDRRAEEGVADRIDAFDDLDHDRAASAIRPWRLDGEYRRAIAALAGGAA
jgi:uncharacterized protein (DUF2336 family)